MNSLKMAYARIGSSVPTVCSVAMDAAAAPSHRVTTGAPPSIVDFFLVHASVRGNVKKKVAEIGWIAIPACNAPMGAAAATTRRVSSSVLHLLVDI